MDEKKATGLALSRTVCGLCKPLLTDDPLTFPAYTGGTALKGDRVFFSVLCTAALPSSCLKLSLQTDSPLSDFISLYRVDSVPVRLPHYPAPERFDEDYLVHGPALLPDLLVPVQTVYLRYGILQQILVEVNVPADFPAGYHPVVLTMTTPEGEVAVRESVTLEVLDAVLPPQELRCTQWFHYDCLATYYGVKVFSPRHWQIVENYLKTARRCGINTILTPVLTPPLDTAVGGERPTVQLVDVTLENGNYRFGFDKLKRFCRLCRKVGMETLEISHFFTQWGAAHAPKVMATVDGEYRQIFGWDTVAAGEEYKAFLHALIPELCKKLDEFGFAGQYFFHISDEPSLKHLDSYQAAHDAVAELLADYPVRDALSDYEFYENGLVKNPIPGVNCAAPFVKKEVPDLWTYYCCGQSVEVSNRFLAMPGYRTRALGFQLYMQKITGFLQWGYNFWYNQYSVSPVNPFVITDADFFVPAGDAFSVYPGPDGHALLSLHQILFEQALYDQRAAVAAEKAVGREAVTAELRKISSFDFMHYPKDNNALLALRDTLNRMAVKEK